MVPSLHEPILRNNQDVSVHAEVLRVECLGVCNSLSVVEWKKSHAC